MNSGLHALIIVLAIIIPGGLIVYFAWRAYKARQKRKSKPLPTPEEAREAFRKTYPRIK